jgi:putative glutamine amidotransferase
MHRPLIGLTPSVDRVDDRLRIRVNATYLDMLAEAGGAGVILTPDPELIPSYIASLDGFILTGGPDIDVTAFGGELHPRAEVMERKRQDFDFALLKALDRAPTKPTLGICLGMQEMGVHRGCRLIQHIHDEIANGDRHCDDRIHTVTSTFGDGPVRSYHHQALGDAGPYEVIATSDDSVIEGIRDPRRPFYVGVQWHPERTENRTLGVEVMRRLVEAARA